MIIEQLVSKLNEHLTAPLIVKDGVVRLHDDQERDRLIIEQARHEAACYLIAPICDQSQEDSGVVAESLLALNADTTDLADLKIALDPAQGIYLLINRLTQVPDDALDVCETLIAKAQQIQAALAELDDRQDSFEQVGGLQV